MDDNPLRNAPHTAASLTGKWDHPYSREEAAFPAGAHDAEGVAAGAPDRRREGRPQPRVLVPAAVGLRGLSQPAGERGVGQGVGVVDELVDGAGQREPLAVQQRLDEAVGGQHPERPVVVVTDGGVDRAR